ncbi:MAG: LuxR C-terminal-related transcriptional regulator [Solirubrobacterales bacterium]
MTRTAVKGAPVAKRSKATTRAAAVVGSGSARWEVAETLRGFGWEIVFRDAAEDLSPGMASVAILVGRSLAEASEGAAELSGRSRGPVLLAVCETIRPGELRQALAAGIVGVVLAETVRKCLAPCMTAVAAGQICVPREQSGQVDAASLSPRERQILGLVVMGYMNGEIANHLVVAESTVKSHLSSAFAKLGVKSRGEAVDLILDSERGVGMGILAIGGEQIDTSEDGNAASAEGGSSG